MNANNLIFLVITSPLFGWLASTLFTNRKLLMERLSSGKPVSTRLAIRHVSLYLLGLLAFFVSLYFWREVDRDFSAPLGLVAWMSGVASGFFLTKNFAKHRCDKKY